MIPRVRLSLLGGDRRSAFERGEKGRPLRVVFDRATLSAPDVELLVELCRDEEIEGLSTSPDDGLQHLAIGKVGRDDLAPLPTEHGFEGFVWPVSQIKGHATAIAEKSGEPEDEVFASLMLSAAAAERRADALVTESPTLLQGATPREGNAVTLDEAFALVGLYLRSRDRFTVGRIADESEFLGFPVVPGFWMTYWVMSREHVPSGWRWFSACVGSKSDGDMIPLGESVLRRVDRAFRIRDRLQIECHRELTDRANDEALFLLDVLLFTLYGAFDGAARVAHRAYDLPLPLTERDAGWLRKRWRRQLRKVKPELVELVRPGTDSGRLLLMMSLLRNTIHGAPIRAIGTSGYDRRNLVEIPESERHEVAELAEALGGISTWGMRMTERYVYVEPDLFCERLMPPTLELLDQILAATDVERLPDVDPSSLSEGPPDKFPFSAEIRRRLRLLGGVG
jgi:hypothetical protein